MLGDLRRDWSNREAAGVSILVAAVSIAIGLVERSIAWTVVAFLTLAGITVLLQHRRLERRRARHAEEDERNVALAAQAAAQARHARLRWEVEMRRQRTERVKEAWTHPFSIAGNDFATCFNSYHLRRSPENWTALQAALRRVRYEANRLQESDKRSALRHLERFASIQEGDADHYQSDMIDFYNWLSAKNDDLC